MKIRRRVQKYIFIISFAVLAGFMHQNTYAETRTNIQLYVPDDNQNNRQENNQTANRADNAVYGIQRSPFCFRTAVFRNQRPSLF